MDKIRFQRVLRGVFWLPIGISAILALLLILEVRFLVHRQAWVEHTDQVISLSQHLYRVRVEQESGLRAYLLTRDERFLAPFYQGQDVARMLEAQLRQLVSDNPDQQARNERAIVAHREWSAWADQAVSIAKAGKNARNLKFQLRGEALMDRYRDSRTEFFQREEQLRAERSASSRHTVRFVNLSVIALCVLGAGVLAGFGRMHMRNLGDSFNRVLDAVHASAGEAWAQKEWFRTTLSSIGDAVIATDGEGRITFMNSVAERLTGWTAYDATAKPLADVFRIINEQTRAIVENPVDKVRRLNGVVGLANHTLLISKDGQEFAIDDSGAPIFGQDHRMIGIVLVFRDVTQQRDLEAALQSNEKLALAGRLSASIAHEIHNPLDTVGNLLFLLQQRTQGQQDIQQLVEVAQREVLRVTQISKNMLSLHRGARRATPFKVSELVEGVATLVEETVAKGKRMIRITHAFPGEIEGIPSEIRQVLTNVIKNAVEATPDGGIIEIYSGPAREHDQDGLLIQVTDNGTGIPSQMQSRLFSPFATTKQESGTGLGLWVSRSIVEKHGGAIRLANREDSASGTTVSIFLPKKRAS
jgi:PAS domain S-box-containing protein